MEQNVTTLGRTEPVTEGEGPRWMQSPWIAVLFVAFFVVSSLLIGEKITEILDWSLAAAFPIALPLILVEMYILALFARMMRRTHH